MWREVYMGSLLCLFNTFFLRQTFIEPRLISWLACGPQGFRDPPCLFIPNAELQMHTATPNLYVNARELISGAHVCTIGTFYTKPFTQTHFYCIHVCIHICAYRI